MDVENFILYIEKNACYNFCMKDRKAQSFLREYKQKIASVYEAAPIVLPKAEYAHVMSELNSNMSEEDRKSRFVSKPIGEYVYLALNHGFNDYTIVGKFPIENEDEELLEEFIYGR